VIVSATTTEASTIQTTNGKQIHVTVLLNPSSKPDSKTQNDELCPACSLSFPPTIPASIPYIADEVGGRYSPRSITLVKLRTSYLYRGRGILNGDNNRNC